MRFLRYVLITVCQTLLRVLPFPCKTGLVTIGNPDRNSPVLLTGNFRLTVERVKRAIEGIDAYLLVANSRGVNVWCAATGGLLTNHDVVSVLKTSGIEKMVNHRRVILPQLAATGIETKVVEEKSGWRIVWGPVYAAAIPTFVRNGFKKTPEMREVSFPWPERLEMAVAWAFPISLLALALIPLWGRGVVPLVGLVWALSLVIFLAFPLYEHRLRTKGKSVGFVLFDFGERAVPIALWGLFMVALAAGTLLGGEFSWGLVLRWGLSSLVVILLLSLDLTGSTPLYKSGLHEDRLLRITLDAQRCKGAGFCEQVCPVSVFEVDHHQHMATLPGAARCVQCGACVVQCPFDALYLRSPAGDALLPETVRRFKLNMLGKRMAKESGSPEQAAGR
ncbi:MAG: HgcAB-like fusion protein [Candidatus Binataceae bacterium]